MSHRDKLRSEPTRRFVPSLLWVARPRRRRRQTCGRPLGFTGNVRTAKLVAALTDLSARAQEMHNRENARIVHTILPSAQGIVARHAAAWRKPAKNCCHSSGTHGLYQTSGQGESNDHSPGTGAICRLRMAEDVHYQPLGPGSTVTSRRMQERCLVVPCSKLNVPASVDGQRIGNSALSRAKLSELMQKLLAAQYIYIYTCTDIYIYIERERAVHMYICMCIYIYLSTYRHIHIRDLAIWALF